MAPSAADVPSKFDILIDGKGYVYHDAFTGGSSSNVPEKGIYTYTPTFVDRQNTQGNYGDNQQDFWLTFSQKDWSLGEQQRFQGRDDDGTRRYWVGSNVDVRKPGRVSLRKDTISVAVGATVRAIAPGGTRSVWAAGTTNLYLIDSAGSVSDNGAHGLGAAPAKFGLVQDSVTYLSTTAVGSVGVRKWTTGGGYATFSATGSDALASLNNTLYGFVNSTGVLQQYSSGGTASTVFQWKSGDGSAISVTSAKIFPYGSKLAILFQAFSKPGLWIWDGVGASALAELPPDFFPSDACVGQGIIFISGCFQTQSGSGNSVLRPAVLYYVNGTIGLLWTSETTYAGTTSAVQNQPGSSVIVSYDRGVVFTDDVTGKLMFYNIASGSISSMASYTVAGDTPLLSACNSFVFHTRNQATAYIHPSESTLASSGSVTSSLIDFDSSLAKLFRGIKVDFDSGSDGNGGSVDIAYRVEDADGSYTTLQTGATSGTEYNLSGVSGRSISIKITLNKGTSTNGPVLKRLYLRAVPVQQNFERFQVVLNCTGRAEPGVNDPQYIELRDGSIHNKDGLQMATDLRTAAESATPISVTTKFGTLSNCVIEDLTLREVRTAEYVAEATVREV